jgi:hypothetical protein
VTCKPYFFSFILVFLNAKNKRIPALASAGIPVFSYVLFLFAKVAKIIGTTKKNDKKLLIRLDLCQESVQDTIFFLAFLVLLNIIPYLCIVFFIVLDLRLTKVRDSAESHFFCPDE